VLKMDVRIRGDVSEPNRQCHGQFF
jgi:hypothetical protein